MSEKQMNIRWPVALVEALNAETKRRCGGEKPMGRPGQTSRSRVLEEIFREWQQKPRDELYELYREALDAYTQNHGAPSPGTLVGLFSVAVREYFNLPELER